MFPIRETAPRWGVPVATWGLILLNVLVFVFELQLPRGQLEEFYDEFGMVPARVSRSVSGRELGELIDAYAPFLTMMFIHGGWIHLLGNVWTLHLFGDNVEDRMGSARFVVFYLLCGLAAGAIQYYTNPMSRLPSIGASGAIAGVMGAYLVLFPRARIITLIPVFIFPVLIELPAFFYLGFWYLVQFLNGSMALHQDLAYGGVAWWAHVGGFAAGIVLLPGFLLGRWRPAPHPIFPDSKRGAPRD